MINDSNNPPPQKLTTDTGPSPLKQTVSSKSPFPTAPLLVALLIGLLVGALLAVITVSSSTTSSPPTTGSSSSTLATVPSSQVFDPNPSTYVNCPTDGSACTSVPALPSTSVPDPATTIDPLTVNPDDVVIPDNCLFKELQKKYTKAQIIRLSSGKIDQLTQDELNQLPTWTADFNTAFASCGQSSGPSTTGGQK